MSAPRTHTQDRRHAFAERCDAFAERRDAFAERRDALAGRAQAAGEAMRGTRRAGAARTRTSITGLTPSGRGRISQNDRPHARTGHLRRSNQ